MNKTQKGKKGFQTINPEDVKNKRINVYLSEKELYKLKEYCSKKEKSISVIIRELILDKIN